MELKEYYKILRANISVVIYTILIFAVAVYIWSIKQAETYSASLLLNISRTENQATADYRYDQFYRLQADDKFADTISEWLKMPGITQEIFSKAGLNTEGKSIRQLSKNFQADKMSPEIVEVRFSSDNQDEAKKISDAIGSVISDKTKNLDDTAKDPNWFKIEPSNLIILKNIQDLRINLGIAIVAGLFVGTFLAFGKHYISE